MPDRQSELDALVDHWSSEVAAAEPELRPHLDEIVDHLRTATETRVANGQALESAFSAAVTSFGEPRELSREFARPRNPFGRMLFWLADDRHETRGDLTLAGAWIGISAAWALAMIITPLLGAPLDKNWMIVGWSTTTFGPLTFLDVKVRQMRAARSN